MKLRGLLILLCLAGSAFSQTGTSTQTQGSGGVNTAAGVVGLFTSCSGTQYLGADGACHTAAGGTGNVSSSGTPTNLQIAQWVDATHIQGISAAAAFNAGTPQTTTGDLIGFAAGIPVRVAIGSTGCFAYVSGGQIAWDSLTCDNGTTLAYTGSGGFTGTSYTANGSGAGFFAPSQGTDNSTGPCAAANTACVEAAAAVTAYRFQWPGAAPAGAAILTATNATPSVGAWAVMSQDCTMTAAGVITCTKTGNVAFTAFATQAVPCLISQGCTGQTTANAGFNALSPMTTLGDIEYEDGTPKAVRLAGSTSATKNFLCQTGNGSVSAAPIWCTIVVADVPTLNQNTTGTSGGLTGTPNITVGVVTSGQLAPALGTLSGSSIPVLNGTETWNNGATTFHAFTLNVTNTASANGSTLFDWQVGGNTEVGLDRNGIAASTDTLVVGNATNGETGKVRLLGGTSGSCDLTTNATGNTMTSGCAFSMGSGVSVTGAVTKLKNISTVGATGVVGTFGIITLTGQVAAISTATLCAAASCGNATAGLFNIDAYLDSTVTCATPGSAAVGITLTWTDETGTKSAQTLPLFVNGGATPLTTMALGNTTNFASGHTSVWTTGTIIQYATSYVACTSGTGTYAIRIAVTQAQ